MCDVRTCAAEALLTQPRVVCDGGLATLLEARGNVLATNLWSAELLLSNPEEIRQAHLSFLFHGAMIIETASYQVSRQGFDKAGVAGWERYLLESIDLAESARQEFLTDTTPEGHGSIAIAVSLGPFGACLHDGSEYNGWYGVPLGDSTTPCVETAACATTGADTAEVAPLTGESSSVGRDPSSEATRAEPYTVLSRTHPEGAQSPSSLAAFHRERLAVIDGRALDFLAFETIPCMMEAVVLAQLLRDEFPHRSAWISLCCTEDAKLASGESLDACIRALVAVAAPGLVAVGVNCCPPRAVLPAVVAIQSAIHSAMGQVDGASRLRVIVYPNRGETWDASTGTWSCATDAGCAAESAMLPSDFGASIGTGTGDDEWIRMASTWWDAGVWAIGGCCRTSPDLIARLAHTLQSRV